MRRLFSTFAGGCPGAGLLLLRVAAGIVISAQAVTRLLAWSSIEAVLLSIVAVVVGLLLLAGLWTPISGWLLAALGLWCAVSQNGDPWADILVVAIGAALALVGPGAWSVDARLFGWKRIDLRDQQS